MVEEDRKVLGAVRLSLTENIAYNIVNDKTTYDLFKALSNMYEKPSASNKVFLIRQLVNTKMMEGSSIADHLNEFNSILSRLMSVDIKFDDEVQALLLLSLLPESWLNTITAVSGSTESTKVKFNNIHDLILGEDIRRKTSEEYSNSLLSAEDKGRGRNQDRGQKQNRGRSKSKKRDTIDDRIMDFGASFHATYCKEELERFKDVRYILGLKKRLIFVGQLNKVGYHIGFRDQQWKVTKASKGRIPDLQKAVVGFCEPCVLGNRRRLEIKKAREFIEYSAQERDYDALKNYPKNLNRNGVAGKNNHTFNEEAKRFQISEKEWQGKEVSLVHLRVFGRDSYIKVKYVLNRVSENAKFVKCTFIGYGSYKMGYRFWDSKSHKGVGRFTKNLANKNIVAKHGLSSKITQSLGGSSDTSERSENSRSFEDSGRSNKEDSEDRASSDEGGFETPQVRRSTRESRAPVRYSPSANYLLPTENGKPESYSKALSSKEFVQWKKAINE
ncbi:hypothetical protein Tco_0223449 [Tanacetum coccineum]